MSKTCHRAVRLQSLQICMQCNKTAIIASDRCVYFSSKYSQGSSTFCFEGDFSTSSTSTAKDSQVLISSYITFCSCLQNNKPIRRDGKENVGIKLEQSLTTTP